MPKLKEYKMCINGEWVDAENKKTFETLNPENNEPWAIVPEASAKDVDKAVHAAQKAFEGKWPKLLPRERANYLKAIANQLRENAEMLGKIETIDTGKLFRETKTQANYIAEYYDYFAGLADKVEGTVLPIDKPNMQAITTREPIGVIAAIIPWNSQMLLTAVKLAPALAMGNTVVIKSSELAPATMFEFAKLIEKTGIPKGVVNVVTGFGDPCGKALTTHKNVERIAFTGGPETARHIIRNSAENLSQVSLELGGKGANIVFKDADPEAIERGALRCFRNSGQSCNAPTRMLVEKSMYSEAVERVKKFANKTKVDNPTKEGDHIGPVVSETQFNKIQTLIKKGIDEGAKLVAGGVGKPDGLEKGYFVKPTVFADVNNQMEIARTEIFGPVLSIMPFETEEEAISIANDTPYGLTNYIQTQDQNKANRVARKLRSGMVDVNGAGIAVDAPFGGYKHSGIGREAGAHGLEEFLEVKTVGGWKDN